MEETFADSITGLIFDGQTLRIEFGVTRFDDVKANTAITGRRYPACRLVLPPAAAVDLINRMQQIAAALTQAGVVKQTPRPAPRRRRRADLSVMLRAGGASSSHGSPLTAAPLALTGSSAFADDDSATYPAAAFAAFRSATNSL